MDESVKQRKHGSSEVDTKSRTRTVKHRDYPVSEQESQLHFMSRSKHLYCKGFLQHSSNLETISDTAVIWKAELVGESIKFISE